MTMDNERVEELRKQIADPKKRWPAHSVPASMLEQLDELEEELMREIKKKGGSGVDPETGVQTLPIRVIGQVENEFDEPVTADDIRLVESRIIIDTSLVAGLQGHSHVQQMYTLVDRLACLIGVYHQGG
jgi:hypothetical protein